ncbi:hypothetical protein L1049_002432 [Liquidambar formosana]|uniref:Ubiquitin carboxyl-terminal hydrolase n=1 Tax=Liquidambar formosana TaxID=63359 RepID=A0AAP0NG07_LIQFO
MKIEGGVSVSSLIRKLKHGYRTLSRINWNSASGFHISVAGVLGIGGLILAIRDGRFGNFSSLPWSSERENRSEKLCLVPGLRNLGNNCFLNVILQALASCLCFQRYLQKIIEECDSLAIEVTVESLPLTVALAALLEELSLVRDGRTVLSPQKVMLAMDFYIPNFNLTSQQDAAEAFLHLLSSLREEFSESYIPNHNSLANVSAFSNCRILTPLEREDQSEQKRWQQHYLGPFDGILGSILTCQSCSFQIMMDFEFFHSLPLSPVLSSGGTIMAGCTMEDCLKQFIVAEEVENYRCNQCWHIAAMKYLSSVDGSETDIEKLKSCGEQDSCDCRNLFCLEALPWSNSFSHTFKQLSIARCPKILCIHLQRASMNEFGELVKLQGYISFPLILKLFPFMKTGVEIKNWETNLQRGQGKHQYQCHSARPNHSNMQFNARMLNHIYGLVGENIYSEALTTQEFECTASEPLDDAYVQACQGETSLPQTVGCSDTSPELVQMQSNDKGGVTCQMVPSDIRMYHLVSVVEHFGRAGSGHYTVYRRMRAESENEDLEGASKPILEQWFCISDSDVCTVSEEDVLAAEASLLFYERII